MTEQPVWQGRIDKEDEQLGWRWHQVVNQTAGLLPNCHLIGLASDLGVAANKGRIGAKDGPRAIRNALANLAWHTQANLLDDGDIVATNSLDKSQRDYAQKVHNALLNKDFIIGLGGGHEIAWGSYLGLYSAVEHAHINNNNQRQKRIGVINFDAHFDLRKPAPFTSSGTPFRQIHQHCTAHNIPFNYACLGVAKTANTQALFAFAQHSDTRYLLDEHCSLEAAQSLLVPMLESIDELYVTVCMDAFPPYMAPGVSAPSSLGISADFVISTLRWLAKAQVQYDFHWALSDVAELNPVYDIDNRTAKLAARVIFEMLQAKFSQ